jgi:hypothetical protein
MLSDLAGGSHFDMSDQQERRTREKPVHLMTVSELEAELQRIDQEMEDIHRELQLHRAVFLRKMSLRSMIKMMFFPKKSSTAIALQKLSRLISRRMYLLQRKSSVEIRMLRLHMQSRARSESSVDTKSSVENLLHSNERENQNLMPLPFVAPMLDFRPPPQRNGAQREVYDRSDRNLHILQSQWQVKDPTQAHKEVL